MGSEPIKDILSKPLPNDILGGPNLSSNKSQNYILRFLKEELHPNDANSLKTDVKWSFFLDQHKFVKHSKRRPKKTFLTRKQRKELHLLKLPKAGWNYDSLEPMRQMWCDYMRQNLDLGKKIPSYLDQDYSSFSIIVAKSELVGAELKVIKSKCPSLVGLCGTIVLETKMTFQLVTPTSKLKTIIKDSSLFEFRLDNMRFLVYGKHIATRPTERSVKKVKSMLNPDL